jgi:hypothetical protein
MVQYRRTGELVKRLFPSVTRGRGRDMPEETPDGRYLLINGRRWRRSDPSLSQGRRQELVDELMRARRDVGVAKRSGDVVAEREARSRVHEAKVALGERGAPWWVEPRS